MPTQVRKGHMSQGAKIFNRMTGKQIGKINADNPCAAQPISIDEESLLLLDIVSEGEDGWSGLQVFDLRTGKLTKMVKSVGGWYDQCQRGLLPGKSQSFFTVTWPYPSQHQDQQDRFLVSFLTPDPYLSQADKDWEESAEKAQRASLRQASQSEKERRADLAKERDENPIHERVLAVERAQIFCKSIRMESSPPPPNLIGKHRPRHQKRGTDKPIKHSIQSFNLFASLGLEAPKTTAQLQSTVGKLETMLAECQEDVSLWHQHDRQRSKIKDHIIQHGAAPAGAALLRLAFGIGS